MMDSSSKSKDLYSDERNAKRFEILSRLIDSEGKDNDTWMSNLAEYNSGVTANNDDVCLHSCRRLPMIPRNYEDKVQRESELV